MLEAIQATIYKQILSNRPIELKKILPTTDLNPGPDFFFFFNLITKLIFFKFLLKRNVICTITINVLQTASAKSSRTCTFFLCRLGQ